MKLLKLLAVVLFFSCNYELAAQTKSSLAKKQVNKYPVTFSILKKDFDNLFNQKLNTVIKLSENKYLNNSTMQMNSLNGDIRFLRIKLNYFPRAFMLVQVNGVYSTQVFIMSEDKSVFYKGTIEKNQVLMSKCAEDEIVSE